MSHIKTYSDPLGIYLNEIGKISLLSKEEEIVLAKKIKLGNEKASQDFIQANLRLVVSIATAIMQKQQGKLQILSLLDLIQAGNIGLIVAVKKFDHQRKCRFSTHAYRWIHDKIMRSICDNEDTIRKPVHVHKAFGRYKKADIAIRQVKGEEPVIDDVAVLLGTNKEQAKELSGFFYKNQSVDEPHCHDHKTPVIEFIEDPLYDHNSSENLVFEGIQKILTNRLGADSQQTLVIILYHFYGYSFNELGQHFGVPHSSLHKKYRNCCNKLQRSKVLQELYTQL